MNYNHLQDVSLDYTAAIKKAKTLLDKEEVIVIPSETVYGLAGNIYSQKAIQKIYQLKHRPNDNPLICHISSLEELFELTSLSSMQKQQVELLALNFWPGPLTLVLPKNKISNKINYAAHNFNTVAIRMPSHPVFIDIIKAVGYPLAAPSANISGRPSGTQAEDIAQEFKDTVSLILKAEPSFFGIESTVLDLSSNDPVILRPGSLSLEDIQKVLPASRNMISCYEQKCQVKSPGQKYQHYQPYFPVMLWIDIQSLPKDFSSKRAIITSKDMHKEELKKIGEVFVYSQATLLAKELYHLLYTLENQGYQELWVQTYTKTGVGTALMERLDRMVKK